MPAGGQRPCASFVPRRDGLLLQVTGENDYYGYDNESATPDRAEAEHAVTTIGSLFPAPPAVERKPA